MSQRQTTWRHVQHAEKRQLECHLIRELPGIAGLTVAGGGERVVTHATLLKYPSVPCLGCVLSREQTEKAEVM